MYSAFSRASQETSRPLVRESEDQDASFLVWIEAKQISCPVRLVKIDSLCEKHFKAGK
jgi:hypothetical protein